MDLKTFEKVADEIDGIIKSKVEELMGENGRYIAIFVDGDESRFRTIGNLTTDSGLELLETVTRSIKLAMMPPPSNARN